MTELNRGVKCPEMTRFNDVLWEWIHLCERDARLELWESASWWHNETASVGIFAGAIWRCGGTALRDFSIKRFDVDSAQRADDDKPRHGRCDLYFRLCSDGYYAEAKQIWSPFGFKADFRLNDIQTGFEQAFSQLDRLHEGRASSIIATEQKLALVFLVPHISKNDALHINSRLEQWHQAVQQIQCDALAWTFPSETRALEDKGRKQCFPGVALLIRKFKRPDGK